MGTIITVRWDFADGRENARLESLPVIGGAAGLGYMVGYYAQNVNRRGPRCDARRSKALNWGTIYSVGCPEEPAVMRLRRDRRLNR